MARDRLIKIQQGGHIRQQIQKAIWNEPQNPINLTLEDDAIALHRILKGKIGIQSRVTANFQDPLPQMARKVI